MTTNEPMSLEQVSGMLRNWHDFFPPGHEMHSDYHSKMADAIDAHITSREAKACAGVSIWDSSCKHCKDPVRVCWETNCNGSGVSYEPVGRTLLKCDSESHRDAQEAAQPNGEVVQPVEAVDEASYRRGWHVGYNEGMTHKGPAEEAFQRGFDAALAHPRPTGENAEGKA